MVSQLVSQVGLDARAGMHGAQTRSDRRVLEDFQ
jgi:hypothetical protein